MKTIEDDARRNDGRRDDGERNGTASSERGSLKTSTAKLRQRIVGEGIVEDLKQNDFELLLNILG